MLKHIQTTQSIGVHQLLLKTKEVVVHAGHSQLQELLKHSKKSKRVQQSVCLNNNLLIVTHQTQGAMVVIQLKPFHMLQNKDSKLNQHIHTKE
jgi:hypothetical protein